jgi:hypothetical protein
MSGFTVTDRRGAPPVDRWRAYPLNANPWNDRPDIGPARPAAPDLIEADRLVAGRILGPTGAVARVVRYTVPVPFGFVAP